MQGMPLQDEPEEGHSDGAQQVHVQGMVHSLPSDEFYQAKINRPTITDMTEICYPKKLAFLVHNKRSIT